MPGTGSGDARQDDPFPPKTEKAVAVPHPAGCIGGDPAGMGHQVPAAPAQPVSKSFCVTFK